MWQTWSCKNDSGVKAFKTDVNRAIKNILLSHPQGKKGLVILDDIAFTKDVKKQSSELVNVGFLVVAVESIRSFLHNNSRVLQKRTVKI